MSKCSTRVRRYKEPLASYLAMCGLGVDLNLVVRLLWVCEMVLERRTEMSTLSPVVARTKALSAKKIEIKVPEVSERMWKSLDEVMTTFSEEEVVQIVHRYCDAQDHAKAYRSRRAARVKAALAYAADAGVDLDDASDE